MMEYHYEPAEKWTPDKPTPMRWYIKYAWVLLEMLAVSIASLLIFLRS
jgi:hypothetical protein